MAKKSGDSINHKFNSSEYDWIWAGLDRYLEKNALKQTKQRRQIIEQFLGMNERHVDAEQIHARIKESGLNIGLATIYRTLNLLKDAKLVDQHSFADGRSVFELMAPDTHHDHLVCTRCGFVTEFEDQQLESMKENIAKKLGFVLESHKLDLFGRCLIEDCDRLKK